MSLRKVLVFILSALSLTLAACSGGSSGGGGNDGTVRLENIVISPPSASIIIGRTAQLEAVALYSDDTSADITTSIDTDWSSSDNAIATVSNTGLVTGIASGTVTVTAEYKNVTKSATVLVGDGEILIGVSVTPTKPTLSLGSSTQLTATGVYHNTALGKLTKDITETAVWVSSASSVAGVNNNSGDKGFVLSASAGTANVTASLGGFEGTAVITVSNATLQRVEIEPDEPVNAAGATRQMILVGYYSDGTTRDVTSEATWVSQSTSVATVSNASGSKGLVNTLTVGTSVIVAAVGSITDTTTIHVEPISVTSIDITPAVVSLASGTTVQLTATGTYSDGSTQDITADAVWTTSNGARAAVSGGLVTGVSVGTANITAAVGSVSRSAAVTVTAAALSSIEITPPVASIANGFDQQFTATGIYTDGSTADITETAVWDSSNGAVATVSNTAGTKGLASSLSAGSTQITASVGMISSGASTLTVTPATVQSIQITPEAPSVPNGLTQQFTATATYSNNTTMDVTALVTWSVGNPVASISNAAGTKGMAYTIAQGTTVITAALGGLSDTTNFTVTPAVLNTVQVTPLTVSMSKGSTQQFTATGIYSDNTNVNITSAVTWASTNAAAASVSNAAGTNGLVTAVNTGTATVSATLDSVTGTSAVTVTAVSLTHISVTPASSNVALGATQQLTAIGIYSDFSTQDITELVTWSSSDASTAAVSNAAGSKGLVTGLAEGMINITASLSGATGTAGVTVNPAALTSIVLNPIMVNSLPVGSTRQFLATGYYSDGSSMDVTTIAAWSSSSTARATVSNAAGSKGLVTAISAGTTNITAAIGTVTSANAPVTVTTAALVAINITPAAPSAYEGTTVQFTATGVYTDGTSTDITTAVTWISDNPAVASISNAAGTKGLATAIANNATPVTIIAYLSGAAGSTTLKVDAATLTSIAITPAGASVAMGNSQQFTATGTYSTGFTADITEQVTWTLGDYSIASISNTAGSRGFAVSVAQGSTTVTAILGSVTSPSVTLTVNPATLTSITVTPAPFSVVVGETVQLTAIGHYSNGSTAIVTDTANWVSLMTSRATVGNAAGVNKGLVTGVVAGSTSITASIGAVSGSANVTVTGYAITSISLTPDPATIANGATQQYTAIATYTNGSTEDITSAAGTTWSSNDTGIAAVNATGLATGDAVNDGTVTITVNKAGVSQTASLTVN
ncbi:beta strand repeat-containing protein [Geovibrio thiophilus]|uniref:beta strand repeat-containing protein n=1 Tax=Geovibrio thiophilus TaxID=139438 RepID=UPI0013E3C9D0|nr:Ig-like domain-containing protein [Geovibrio thiophilus]